MRVKSTRLALFSLVLAVVVACSDAGGGTTTTSSSATPDPTSVGSTTTVAVDPALNVALPVDEAVVVGTLENGFTYFLRENDSPGGRAELRLLVDAGSLQEDPDQAGMAHFLEHMMFNGTERFPRNELISILESFGPRFGPDINAYTSYDETVYELSLATDDEELLELGIDVLREWATRATLTTADVVEERGVVLDEWRVRAQGYGARVNEELTRLILEGSPYEAHEPIGTRDSISSATPDILKRFYDRWYRPDRMALVVVGDFDMADMEERIASVFSSIPESEDQADPDPVVYEEPGSPRAVRYVDEEAAQASVAILYPVHRTGMATVGDYQESVAASLGLQILGERITEEALSEDSPLLGGSSVDTAWTRAVGIRGIDIEVRASRARDGLRLGATEVQRITQMGVTDEEFERVMARFESASLQIFEQRDSAQDVEFVALIAAHHLGDGHLMSPEQRYEVESGIAERLRRDDIDTALAMVFSGEPTVLALGPDDAGLEIPDGAEILEVLEDVEAGPIVEREEQPGDVDGLMAAPDPVGPQSSTVDSQFGFTTLDYENGATVHLWESEIAANAVYVLIEGFGGTSVVDLADLPEASLMIDIAGRSGVGEFDATALRRALSDQIADLRLFLTETRQGMEGSASSEDLETLFQLIHLTMTEPRLSASAGDAVLDEIETLNASRDDLPALLFEEALLDAYYGDDPRYFVVPTADQLAEFDLEAARRVFMERFSNPASFAFVFVGDFDADEVATMASQYIGSLPPGSAASGFVDNQPLPPRQVQVTTVAAGVGEQGQVGLFFTNEFNPAAEDRVTARVFELILTSRLRQRVREELSATYSITAGIELQRDPDPFAETYITSSGDPAGLDQIVDEIVSDLEDLQQNGPTEEQFATAVAQLEDDLQLLDNGTIAVGLITAHLYPDQPFVELSRRRGLLAEVTPEDVRDMANIVFDLDQRIEIRQVPRG